MPCKLLIIKPATHKPPVQETGDLVGVFEGTHEFSASEQNKFLIVYIPNFTRTQVVSWIKNVLIPAKLEIDEAYQAPGCKGRWKDVVGNRWYKLKKYPKYLVNLKRLPRDKIDEIESGQISNAKIKQYLRNNFDQIIVRRPENQEEV